MFDTLLLSVFAEEARQTSCGLPLQAAKFLRRLRIYWRTDTCCWTGSVFFPVHGPLHENQAVPEGANESGTQSIRSERDSTNLFTSC